MAHYAFLDENNIVTEVIVGRHEWEVVDGISDWEQHYGDFRGQRCKRTSYNANIRANYATIGSYYDEVNDVFIPPKPYPSWILDSNFHWIPPIPVPDDVSTQENPDGVVYVWDESIGDWSAIDF